MGGYLLAGDKVGIWKDRLEPEFSGKYRSDLKLLFSTCGHSEFSSRQAAVILGRSERVARRILREAISQGLKRKGAGPVTSYFFDNR
jgi:hypothetical protein